MGKTRTIRKTFTSTIITSYDRSNVASLDYAVNRSYSSGQGRFTTVDPIGMDSASQTDPQSNNLYAYVGNDPINFTDSDGLLRAINWASCVTIGYVISIRAGGEVIEIVGEIQQCQTYSLDPVITPDPGGGGGVSVGTPTNNNTSQNNCVTLSALITQIRDELAKRGGDILADLLGLPPTGPMSIAGHVQQFENKQAYLRKLLKEWIGKGCNGPGPRPPIPSDAWKWATKAPPKKSPYRNSSPYAANDPNKQLVQVAAGAVVTVAAGYVIYRIARLLPSLAPPLWWTIPGNLAVP